MKNLREGVDMVTVCTVMEAGDKIYADMESVVYGYLYVRHLAHREESHMLMEIKSGS